MDDLVPSVITLTTDFGLSDTYVGVMKGVILTVCPRARIVDLTHDIRPQNLLEATARLEAAVPYFPPGTIHLIVVDPGVGTARDAVIVRTEVSFFVAPDNGVLTLPLRVQPPIEVVTVTDRARPYFRQPVSATFHGRDVFAPIAAHLAAGMPPAGFGLHSPPADLVSLSLPVLEYLDSPEGIEIRVPILYVDRFGNLITMLRPEDLRCSDRTDRMPAYSVEAALGTWRWRGIAETFASVRDGQPLIYWGSSGRLEVAVRNSSAAERIGAAAGDILSLRWNPSIA